MPYKDPERKRQWEREHRLQRNARRRKNRLVARMAPTTHDPVAAQEPQSNWKTVLGWIAFIGITALAAWSGASVPPSDCAPPSTKG